MGLAALCLLLAAAPPSTTSTTSTTSTPSTTSTASTTPHPITRLTQAELIAREAAAVDALGTYRVRLTKRERIDGKLQDPQTYELLIQPATATQPLAISGRCTAGDVKGRQLLYNAALRKDEFLVREAGVLGIAGSLWLSLDSSLAREDSNHPMTNMGFASVIRYIKSDAEKTAPYGGHARASEGVDVDGYCIRWQTPPQARGTYCSEAHICIDPETYLIRRIDLYDEIGMKESLHFQVLERRLTPSPATFTPAGAGL